MKEDGRFATRAVTAMEMPRILAEALGRPILTMRARRGGRRRYERMVSAFGERAVQILDTDGYLLLVVENELEQRRIIGSALATSEQIDITAWDASGEAVPIDKGIG